TSVIDFGHLSNPSKIGWGVNLALMLVVAWLILPGMAIADRLPVTGPGPPVLRYMIVVVVVATLAGFAFPCLQNDLVSSLLILFNQEPPGGDRSLVFSIW